MLWCCVCVWWAFLHTKTTRQIKLSAQKERGNIVFIEEKRILLVASSNVNVDEIEFRQQTLKRKMNEYVNDGWMHRCTETKNKTSFVIFFFSLFYGRANKDDNRSILWWLALVWMTFEFQQEIIWPQLTSIISQLCSLLIGCQGTYEHGQNLEFRHR